jgi:lysophospholipase L1-like esterase
MRIKAPSLVSMGFIDTTTPPVGIWTAFNQIRGPREAVPMLDSPHNHLATPAQLLPYTRRSAEWLDTWAAGGKVKPNMDFASAGGVKSVPRMDLNSRVAHAQLVQKARAGAGRIGVYFGGDSITRRWGSADLESRDLLGNWTQNFFGWNAADFGWGADTARNVLWRLEHGELDGVNPKVIVLLAGTNDLEDASLRGTEEDKAASIAATIRAIIELCRAKAPGATVVLTSIAPRSDKPALLPLIARINAKLAPLADGRTVRYLDLHGRLADADGRLLPGMAHDGLHFTVKGYQVWADLLKPVLTEILGPPATFDTAPPPSSNPRVDEPKR